MAEKTTTTLLIGICLGFCIALAFVSATGLVVKNYCEKTNESRCAITLILAGTPL